MVKLRDKEELFLTLLRGNFDKAGISQRIRCFQDKDWQSLYLLAAKSGLFPIFYNRLISLRLENISQEFLSRLKFRYFLNLKRGLLLEKELLRIISYFNESGIPFMPLKGPVLARYLYGDTVLRQAPSDLDILVPLERIAQAEDALLAGGFIQKKEEDAFRRRLELKYGKALPLEGKANILGSYTLDLHWDLRGFFVDTHLDNFWQNTRKIELDGHMVLMPSDTDLLFYLSLLSVSTFEFVEMRYLYDLHSLISKFKNNLDWDKILERAKDYNFKFYIYFALKLCKEFFGTDIPEEALYQLRPRCIKKFIVQAWINRKNILWHRQNVAAGYLWRYLISSYIHSKNFPDFLKRTYQKIFLPMNEVMGMYDQPLHKKSYLLYAKRLLKPILRNLN
jgi:hypothetical protein